jgi:Tfp pilus assembly protein PilW
MTLIELLVASAMGVVLMGAVAAVVMGAMRSQPEISARSQNVSKVRYVLERLTREIRNGVAVDPAKATASQVSFRSFVRRTSCGAAGAPASSAPAIECQITYTCTTTSCSRGEGNPGSSVETSKATVIAGIDDANVFAYQPSAAAPTFIEVTLHIPNPKGPADVAVSDGASLRNATLGY